MTLEEKRNAIRTLVRRIVWDGENVHIYFLGCDYDDSNVITMDTQEEKMLPLGKDSKRNPYGFAFFKKNIERGFS